MPACCICSSFLLQFSLQLISCSLYPSIWEELPESILCDKDIYGRLATFLTKVYKTETGKNKGEPLGLDSALGYLGSLLNQAKVKFKAVGSDKSKLFLTCMDENSTTDAGYWLKGLKKNITRDIFQKRVGSGEELDHSAEPIYLLHVRLMVSLFQFRQTYESHVCPVRRADHSTSRAPQMQRCESLV